MKTLGVLLRWFVLAAVLYTGWKMAPLYFEEYELEDAMNTIARFSAIDSRKTESDIHDRVVQEAHSLGVPISPENVYVQRTLDNVFIWGDYTARVDVPLYPFDLHFRPMSKNVKRVM